MILILMYGIIIIGILETNFIRNIGILLSTVLFSIPLSFYYLKKIYDKS
jgi:hypothetical protein